MKKLAVTIHTDDPEIAAAIPVERTLIGPVEGLNVNLLFVPMLGPVDDPDLLVIGRLKITREGGVERYAQMVDEIAPDERKTAEVTEDGMLVVSVTAHDEYRHYDSFRLSDVKTPPGTTLALVSNETGSTVKRGG